MQHINIKIKPVVHKKIHKMHLQNLHFHFMATLKKTLKCVDFFIYYKNICAYRASLFRDNCPNEVETMA